jgi:hypothetical protein
MFQFNYHHHHHHHHHHHQDLMQHKRVALKNTKIHIKTAPTCFGFIIIIIIIIIIRT